MKVICLLGGQDEHRFQQNKKIGSRKSAVDYRELLWINRHMSISEWEAHCLSLHECDKDFWFPMWLNFTCLITALLFFFFVVGVIMKEISTVMTWFMEMVKSFENLSIYAAGLWIMFFVTFFIGFFKKHAEIISHVSWSLILAKFSCSWSIMTIKALHQKL